jgi:nucleotide-binding universal stress UspA family protein
MNGFPNKILLATDGSEYADLAARVAIELSNRTASELHVVHVWHDVPTPTSTLS